MKDITLNIKGTQYIFGDNNDVDMTVEANIEIENDKYIINYYDEDLYKTIITVEGNAVTLDRQGEDEAQIVFEKAMPYMISYSTPVGLLGINMYTTMVDADVNHKDGKIEIEYVMDMMGRQMVNKLYMSYSVN